MYNMLKNVICDMNNDMIQNFISRQTNNKIAIYPYSEHGLLLKNEPMSLS